MLDKMLSEWYYIIVFNKLNKMKGGRRMGYKIKECREEIGISQEELAKRAKISRTTLSGLESGTLKTTTTDTLLKIARALNKKVSDIFF